MFEVSTGPVPCVAGSTVLFTLDARNNGLWWDLSGGSASLLLTDPGGTGYSYPAGVVNGVPGVYITIDEPPGTWLYSWDVTDASGTRQVSVPNFFQVVDSMPPPSWPPAGTYGNATDWPIITLDRNGHVSAVTVQHHFPFVNVKNPPYSAVGDGVANDTAAVAAAMAASPTVYFPTGTYKVTGPISITRPVRLFGDGQNLSLFVNSGTGDLFQVGTSFCWFDAFAAQSAGGGHVFNITGGLGSSLFTNLQLAQQNTGASIIHLTLGQGFIGNTVRDCFLNAVAGATVPPVSLSTTGGQVNINIFDAITCNGCTGVPFFLLENQDANYCYDNLFRGINFELCVGGCVRALSVQNLTVDNCWVYDLTATTTAAMFYLGKSVGGSGGPGPGSRKCVFKQVTRRAGTLGGGLADITLAAGTGNVLIEYCSTQSAGNKFVLDLGQSAATLVGMLGAPSFGSDTTVLNTGTETYVDGERVLAVQTSAYNMLPSDGLIPCDATSGAFAVTLFPAAFVPPGKRITIKKVDATGHAVTVTRTSPDTIDGANTYALSAQWKYVVLECDGLGAWYVVANN